LGWPPPASASGCWSIALGGEAGYRLYVSNEKSGDVTVIDGATRTVIANVAAGKRPRGIHMSADGKTVYVALQRLADHRPAARRRRQGRRSGQGRRR